jgi:hypothetical protein
MAMTHWSNGLEMMSFDTSVADEYMAIFHPQLRPGVWSVCLLTFKQSQLGERHP